MCSYINVENPCPSNFGRYATPRQPLLYVNFLILNFIKKFLILNYSPNITNAAFGSRSFTIRLRENVRIYRF